MDPVTGYILLRYFLLLGCGVPLYLWSRQRFGVGTAVASYLFLFSNPLLPRVMLWDLTTFVSVPAALAGICVWQLETRHRLLNRFMAGFLFCISVASQAFTGTAILTFFLVELCHRLAKRQFHMLIVYDMLAPSVGAAVCFALGMLFYYVEIGPFDPTVVFSVTAGAAKVANVYAMSHSAATLDWLATETHVYVPYLFVLVAVSGLGRAMLSGSSEARITWFGVVYASAYAVYQFAFHGFILETFYYFAHLTIVAYLLFPVCVALLTARHAQAFRRFLLGLVIGLLLLFPLLNRFAPAPIDLIELWMHGSMSAAILIGLAGIICALLVRLPSRAALGMAAVLLTGFVQLVCFTSPIHRIIFTEGNERSTQHERREIGVYRAAVQMLECYSAIARPDAKVMLWYPSDDGSLSAIASTVLLYTLQHPFERHNGFSEFGAYERSRSQVPGLRYIMMLSMSAAGLEDGQNTLQREGFEVREVLRRKIGDDAFQADLELVEIGRGGRFRDTTSQGFFR
jgi:hypothetical protein